MPERKLDYTSLVKTAHKGFLIEAPSLQRLYIDSGLALTDQLVKLDLIQDHVVRTVTVQGDSQLNLMVAWLNALVQSFLSEKFLAKRIVFNQFDGKKISATIHGQYYSPIQHGHVGNLKEFSNSQIEVGMKAEPENGFYTKVTILLQDH